MDAIDVYLVDLCFESDSFAIVCTACFPAGTEAADALGMMRKAFHSLHGALFMSGLPWHQFESVELSCHRHTVTGDNARRAREAMFFPPDDPKRWKIVDGPAPVLRFPFRVEEKGGYNGVQG